MVGRFSYSPQAGHLSSSFGAWWGDSLTRPRLDISRHRLACGGEILLLAPGWTSLIIIRCVVGRFSYSPQAGHLWSSFGAWWGDSLTRPRLDISGRRSAHGGEILLLCPRLDISRRRSAHGGEILLLTPGWTSLVVIIRRVVGRFSYSPQAGHLSSLFGAWWGDSLTRPRLDISCHRSVHGEGDSLTRPRLDISRHCSAFVVGRFSYSPQAGHLSNCHSSHRRVTVGRFSYSPQAGHL